MTTPQLTCNDLLKYLSEYIDGNLDDELVAAALRHLETCKNCSIVLDSTQRTIALYKLRGQQQQMSPDRYDTMYQALERALKARGTE